MKGLSREQERQLTLLTQRKADIFHELWFRCGSSERAARRFAVYCDVESRKHIHGITASHLRRLAKGQANQIDRVTVLKAIALLRAMRETNEAIPPDRRVKAAGPRSRSPRGIRNGHKLCRGPTHPEAGAWVPIKEFYPTLSEKSAGWFSSRCKECCAYNLRGDRYKGPGKHGLIQAKAMRPFIAELYRFYGGQGEAAKAVGVSRETLSYTMSGKQEKMTKECARLIFEQVWRIRHLSKEDLAA